jgi:nitrogen fixation/metabolism regulation signal transduction histidine kinase
MVITRGITSSIKRGLQFVESVTQGDLTTKLEIRSNDEIGKLTDSISNMAEILKGNFEECAIMFCEYLQCRRRLRNMLVQLAEEQVSRLPL